MKQVSSVHMFFGNQLNQKPLKRHGTTLILVKPEVSDPGRIRHFISIGIKHTWNTSKWSTIAVSSVASCQDPTLDVIGNKHCKCSKRTPTPLKPVSDLAKIRHFTSKNINTAQHNPTLWSFWRPRSIVLKAGPLSTLPMRHEKKTTWYFFHALIFSNQLRVGVGSRAAFNTLQFAF